MNGSSLEDDLQRLSEVDGDWSDEDAQLLNSTLQQLHEGIEPHDSDEDNVDKLEKEIKGLRDDITSQKHEFPKGLEEELREAQLLEGSDFNDQNANRLTNELGGLEHEFDMFPDAQKILKDTKNSSQSISNGTSGKPAAVVTFNSVRCCPMNCKICGRSSFLLARSRQAKLDSG